jgi:hypothetical protein
MSFEVSMKYQVCVCILALVITIANRIFSIQFHTVWLYRIFPCYLMNGTLFKKKGLLNIKCTLWFYLQILSKTFLIQDEFGELLSQKYISLHIKYPLFLQDFNEP